MPIRKLGSDQVYDESVLFSALLLPLVFGMLLFLSITTTSQFLMSGVVEEKENRMMELLMTSSRPSEMLWGKIIGLGALGLTQMIIWGVLGFAFATLQGTANLSNTLANLQVTPGLLLLMLAYFLLGYLLFGAIMAGLGASVNAEAESRQLAGIFGFVTIVPFVLFISFLNELEQYGACCPQFVSIDRAAVDDFARLVWRCARCADRFELAHPGGQRGGSDLDFGARLPVGNAQLWEAFERARRDRRIP